MKMNFEPFELPEIVNARCQAAYTQIYQECGNAASKPIQKECVTMDNKKKITVKKRMITAVVIAAAIAAVPMGAIAYEHFTAKIERTGAYQNTVTITPPATEAAEATAQYMALDIGWLPEGYCFDEAKGKYNGADGGGITCMFVRIPDDMIVIEQINNSISSKQYETDGKQILISNTARSSGTAFQDTYYSHEIWVLFDGTSYAAHAFLTSDLTASEVEAFAEGLALVPSDKETAGEYVKQETYFGNNSGNNVSEDGITLPFDMEALNLYALGETATVNCTSVNNTEDTISITVNSAELQTNFDGITTGRIGEPADYSEYMDENGNVIDNVRTWYNQGDGVNTLDETIRTDTIGQNILVMNLTYTNESDHDTEYNIFPTLFTVAEDRLCRMDNIRPDVTERYWDSLPLYTDGTAFSLQTEHAHDKNHLILAPGESADVQLAFLVGDDMLGNVYMNIHGNYLLTYEENLPVLDLCEIR